MVTVILIDPENCSTLTVRRVAALVNNQQLK